MSTPGPLQSLRLSVACGTVPCDTEEGRRFLQERLVLFGKVTFGICLFLTIVTFAVYAFAGSGSIALWLRDPYLQLPLAGCGASAIIYGLCRWGRRSHLQLAALDILTIFAIGGFLGMRCADSSCESVLLSAEGMDYFAILGISNALLARSVIVPSSAWQTFVASSLAMLPVVLGMYSTTGQNVQATAQSLSAAVPIILATAASHIIYGLRQEVQEAKQFGQYTLEERIGQGGMGEVFKARHALLRRPTAVKLLRPDIAGERSVARFEREVQLTSRLTHPNTVAIYDYGHTPDGIFYYAMEYLDGINLEELIEHYGAQPPARVIHILEQICGSLVEAHGAGLIHRDIKPANIILCERGARCDVVKVVDFGLVKDIEQRVDATISSANTITGTPLYLSPESIRAPNEVDARSDLYAVGAVGYFLLCGKHIFDSTSFMEICSHHLHTRPTPPSQRTKNPVPADLEGLILMCLEKRREDRPRDAASLLGALRRCADSDGWTEDEARHWWQEHRRAAAARSPSAVFQLGTREDALSTPTVDAERLAASRERPGEAVAGQAAQLHLASKR